MLCYCCVEGIPELHLQKCGLESSSSFTQTFSTSLCHLIFPQWLEEFNHKISASNYNLNAIVSQQGSREDINSNPLEASRICARSNAKNLQFSAYIGFFPDSLKNVQFQLIPQKPLQWTGPTIVQLPREDL